jgi:hypothetical protein
LESWKGRQTENLAIDGGGIDPATSRTAKNVGFDRARKRISG